MWAVGYGSGLFHYDGKSWAPAVAGTNDYLKKVWAADSQNVWMIGGTGDIFRYRP